MAPCPPLATISVIFVTPDKEARPSSRVMSISSQPEFGKGDKGSKRIKAKPEPILGFSKADKVGTFQPHNDVLVVTLQIGGFNMKNVMVDQENGAEIMYPNLYKGLNLKPEDLNKYNSPLVGFDGRTIIPKGMIKLPVQTDNEVVKVEFIVVDAYSPYITILARPWLHAMGPVSSTLHMKVKYLTKGRVGELVGCQKMAR